MNIATIVPWVILICWLVLVVTWIVSAFWAKPDIGRNVWFRFLWFRILIVAVFVGVTWYESYLGKFTHHVNIANPSNNTYLVALAALLCLFGIILAIWARFYLGRNWSPAPAIKEGHELVTSGPYRLVRHPIYTGILMAMLGSALLNLAWIFVFIIFTCMFVWRVKREENLMMKQFPDQYPEYKKRTWALIPYIW